MTAKLVCRLLDADGNMLGWCMHNAVARGDGLLRAAEAVLMPIDYAGKPHTLSIHWADVNSEIRVPVPPEPATVDRGQSFVIFQPNQPMLNAGQPPQQRLPPVSVGTVLVNVPVGQIGAPSGVMEVTAAS